MFENEGFAMRDFRLTLLLNLNWWPDCMLLVAFLSLSSCLKKSDINVSRAWIFNDRSHSVFKSSHQEALLRQVIFDFLHCILGTVELLRALASSDDRLV